MAYGTLFVLSEAFDFALENPIYISLVALVSFYVGLEVTGYGIVCQLIYTQRVKKLDDDLMRVRELQHQLGALRNERAQRNSVCSKEAPVGAENKEVNEKGTKDPTDIPSTTSASSTDRSNTMGSSSVVSAKDVEHSNETQGAASNVYESVKDAWTWGRHETPFSPLLGLAEGLTSQTIGLFGTDLKCLDDALKPCVADLDEHVLKPTLSNVSSFLADRTKPADTDEVVEQPRVENKTEETAGAS